MPCPSPDPGHPGCACARRRRGAGFTLLEVLAAAVIMAMVYGVLAEQGVQGFVLEGDADRRLRASLVADRRLDALRTEAAGGAPPPLGVQEDREQEFGVRVEVRPFDLALVTLLPAPPEAALPDRPPRRGGPPEPSLLAPPARGREPPQPCNPAFDDGLFDGCEPYYFCHAYHARPMTLFYDGHIQTVGVRQAEQDSTRNQNQAGYALWRDDTPNGADGYFIPQGYDFSNASAHMFTTDGIRGRDIIK